MHVFKKHPPGDFGYPLFGNLADVVTNTRNDCKENEKKHGLIYSDKTLNRLPNVVVNRSDDLSLLWDSKRKHQADVS